jgi:hypothetical protein
VAVSNEPDNGGPINSVVPAVDNVITALQQLSMSAKVS